MPLSIQAFNNKAGEAQASQDDVTAGDAASLQTASLSDVKLTDPVQLVSAFEQFGQLSNQLQQSYHALEQRTAQLAQQLEQSQSERLAQLAEKEQLANRLETLLNALPAAVLWVDQHGTIQTANPAAEFLFEQTLSQRCWQSVYAESVASSHEQQLLLHNGKTLSVQTRRLEQQQGEIILLNDISEQLMLQQLANRHNRLAAMGQMAAGLAHQLRTPLASAVLYASHLTPLDSGQVQMPAQHNKAISKISASLRYLEKLVNDMLMYAKGGRFSEQVFALDDLLMTFSTRIDTRLKEYVAELKIISQLNNIQLSGSLDALVSVLVNLAENALEAFEQAKLQGQCELQLEVYQQGDYLILALRDNGPGLSSEQQSKIFQAFYSEKNKGTGLGLAVAQSIVQAHHGDLLVRSQPGQGASFYVCLPLQREEQFLASGQHEF